MNYKKSFFLLIFGLIIFVLWTAGLTIEEDPINVKEKITYTPTGNIDLKALKGLSSDQLDTHFPKQKLIDSIDFENPHELNQVINTTLGLIHGDSMQVYRYFVKSFFEETILKNNSNLKYNPEILLHQIIVAENYRKYAEINTTASIYASAISDQYFQQVSNKLEVAQQKETNLVNKFSFQYLVQRCRENNYFPNRKETSIDKFMKTFIEQDYFHLINTTIQKTTILQKMLILSILIFTLIGGVQTLIFIKKIISKNV